MAFRKIRPIRIEGNVAYVPLTKGYEAVIDAADATAVEGALWHVHVSGHTQYAGTMVAGAKRSRAFLHRLLICADNGQVVDHIDGDGLNNRRSNLRIATQAENLRNCRKPSTNTSGVKGVHWCKRNKKWQAQIKDNGKSKYLGLFASLEDAGAAYAKASADIHGAFGRTR